MKEALVQYFTIGNKVRANFPKNKESYGTITQCLYIADNKNRIGTGILYFIEFQNGSIYTTQDELLTLNTPTVNKTNALFGFIGTEFYYLCSAENVVKRGIFSDFIIEKAAKSRLETGMVSTPDTIMDYITRNIEIINDKINIVNKSLEYSKDELIEITAKIEELPLLKKVTLKYLVEDLERLEHNLIRDMQDVKNTLDRSNKNLVTLNEMADLNTNAVNKLKHLKNNQE